MNGQKERLMVLDMVAEGKITADEAQELLQAMETPESSASPADEPVPPLPALAVGAPHFKDLVAALKEAGIDHVTLSDLQELLSEKITAEYIREMLAVGLRPDGLDEWIELRE